MPLSRYCPPKIGLLPPELLKESPKTDNLLLSSVLQSPAHTVPLLSVALCCFLVFPVTVQAALASWQASQLYCADLQVLSEKKIGIVAHFYMDPQVQGVLTSAAQRWPHIHISDSLVMADRAVKMVEEGCSTVAVLGVDFMSENVRAILDEAGHRDVKVWSCCWNLCSLVALDICAAFLHWISVALSVLMSMSGICCRGPTGSCWAHNCSCSYSIPACLCQDCLSKLFSAAYACESLSWIRAIWPQNCLTEKHV